MATTDRTFQELIDWLLSWGTKSGWPTDWKTSIALRELAASLEGPTSSHALVVNVLTDMIAAGKRNLTDFREIAVARRNSRTSSPTQSWDFFLPWSVALESSIVSPLEVRVCDKTVAILTKDSVETELGAERLSPVQLENLLRWMPYTPTVAPTFLRITQEGSSWEAAWDAATPAFDAFRGGMEYLLAVPMMRAGWSEFEPLAQIPHPEWMLHRGSANPDTVEGTGFIPEYARPRRRAPLAVSHRMLTALRDVLIMIGGSPPSDSTAALFADVLRLYAQAMDANLPYANFLGLWQVCEAVALSTRIHGDTTKVCQRLEWHADRLGLAGSGFRRSLRRFADLRNDLVHRGLRHIGQDDVNDLLRITEIAVDWLRSEAERLPTLNVLEAFYRFRTANDAETASARLALEYLRAERERGSTDSGRQS